MKIQHLLISSFAIATLACGCSDDSSNHADDTAVPENTAERCADGLDNDNNGKTDCDEESCKAFDNCMSEEKQCPASMPEGKKDCTCDKANGTWTGCKDIDAGEIECPTSMPEGMKDCTCDKTTGTWTGCTDIDSSEIDCPAAMPEGNKDCTCDKTTGTWTECTDIDSGEKQCPASMPENATDCMCIEGEWLYCVNSCTETCTNGYSCDATSGECNCNGRLCNDGETCTESGCLCGGKVCNENEHCESDECICDVTGSVCDKLYVCGESGCLCQGKTCNWDEVCGEDGCKPMPPALHLTKDALKVHEDASDADSTWISINKAPASNITISWPEVENNVRCVFKAQDAHSIEISPEGWSGEREIACQLVEPDTTHTVGDKTITRTFTVTSEDEEWNGLTKDMTIVVLDADQAGMDIGCGTLDSETLADKTVWSCKQATTSEKGSYYSLGINNMPYFNGSIVARLTANPECTIKIEASIANDDGTPDPYAELVGDKAKTGFIFNSENWDKAQVMELKGTDDGANPNETPHPYTITLHPVPDSSCTDEWKNLSDYTISAVNLDNDIPTIFINRYKSELKESGQEDISYIRLEMQPAAQTTLTAKLHPATNRCTLLNGAHGQPVSEYKLIFTEDNYDKAQMLSVQSVDNEIDDGNAECNILLKASSSDTNPATTYNGLERYIKYTVINDDFSGISTISYDAMLGEKMVSGSKPEDNRPVTGTWQLKLNVKPTADVTITPEVLNHPVSDKVTHLEITSSPIVFTPQNYNTPQEIQYKSVQDYLATGNVKVSIKANASSTDPNYNGLSETADITIDDFDVISINTSLKNTMHTLGDVLREREPLKFYTFYVNLTTIPAADVTLTLTPSSKRVTLSKRQRITPPYKSDTQTLVIPREMKPSVFPIYIYPINNTVDDGDAEVYIEVKSSSADSDYNNKTVHSDKFIVRDDDPVYPLNIYCQGTAACTNGYNDAKCSFNFVSPYPDKNNSSLKSLGIFCESSKIQIIPFEITSSENWLKLVSPISSKLCESNSSATKTATETFTCHSEGPNFYATGEGTIKYLYNE